MDLLLVATTVSGHGCVMSCVGQGCAQVQCAQVLGRRGRMFRVTFIGWKSFWDETLPKEVRLAGIHAKNEATDTLVLPVPRSVF